MRAKVLIGLVGALLAAVVLASASGAATAKAQKVTRIDVSTRVAVINYLRSIHVNPKGAVIQRGGFNYAGARCPGVRWTCASTRHTVVQIAGRGGQNRFACRSAHCVVVQISGASGGVYISGRQLASTAASTKGGGGGSTAVCVKSGSGATTGTGQSCVISQVGSGPNTAGVYENTQKVSGLTQSAQYTALITQQSSGSNSNTACVTQNISLDGSASNTNGKLTTASLQAHQSVTIKQDATGSGANNAARSADASGNCTGSTITQSQTLTSTITATGPITQGENDLYRACGDSGVAPAGMTDYANLCLDIEQNQNAASAAGTNNANFTQNSSQTAIANATKGAVVNQTQSTPLCPNSNAPNCAFPGGLVGTVNQSSTGRSTASATQTETQCEDAATSGLTTCSTTPDPTNSPNIAGGLHQTQYGPVGVGTIRHTYHGRRRVGFAFGKGLGQSIQTGNTNCTGGCNSFTVDQHSTQNADRNATQVNRGQADCGTTGSCTAGQTTTVNGSPTHDGYTAPNIGNLIINCPTGTTCTGTPPPVPTILTEPDQTTQARTAAFTFNDAPATSGFTFQCSTDGVNYNPCLSGSTNATFSGLGTGSHSFYVEAVDTTATHNASAPASFTWTIVDANISLSPASATNEVGTTHTVTCTINQDKGDGQGFVAAPNGTTCTGSVLAGGPNAGSIGSCTTTSGSCTITYTDTGGTGTDTIHATTTFLVGGVSMTRATLSSGTDVHQDGLDVSKTWVSSTSSNLITNGSFETDPFSYNGTLDLGGSNPLTGWTTLSNGTYPWGLPYPNTYNAGPTPYGNQWVIVGDFCDQGTSWIEQTIDTTVGQTYTLSFALASEEGGTGAQVVVSFPTGSSTASQTFTAPPRVTNFWDTWATSSMDFTANDTSTTIRFTSVPLTETEGCDAGIDNVSVTAG